jgi:hypothetical protein
MSIIAHREVLPRTFSHKFGESPTAERKFVVTTDAPEAHQSLLNTVGIFHGSAHPEFGYLLCTEGTITETDRQHAEITYRYESPSSGTAEYQASPLSRPDVWSFSTGGAAVPATIYYEGTGNGTRKPLINSAGDFLESAMTEEAELRASISGNRSAFPLADAVAVTNTVNNASFLGGDAHKWKCQGISGQQQVEVVNGAEVKYWAVTAELVYRQSGWNLPLLNVGWNFISQAGTANAQKQRCYVFFEGSDGQRERVASANVMALNDDGSIRFNTDFTGSGAATILNRRVHRESNFSTYFGTPPF